jgi:hypothetical protein
MSTAAKEDGFLGGNVLSVMLNSRANLAVLLPAEDTQALIRGDEGRKSRQVVASRLTQLQLHKPVNAFSIHTLS